MKKQTAPEPYDQAEHVSRLTVDYVAIVRTSSLTSLEEKIKSSKSVKDILNLWLRVSLFLTRRRPEIAVSSLLIHFIPIVGDLSIERCDKITLNRVFNKILSDGYVNEAKRVFALSKQFMTWCEHQGYIEVNPLSSMTRKDVGGKAPEPGERALSDAEIWCFWHGLDMWDFSEQVRWGLRFCLLAARRPDEVFRARKREFDLEAGIWRQGSRNKSRREHSLPMSPLMKHCIQNLFNASPESEWLCPARLDNSVPISKGAPAQAIRRMVRDYAGFGVDEFTPRDLRRTARTKLSELGIQNDVSRKIMNHALEGIDRVYDRYSYFDHMKEALDALSDDIGRIVEADSYRMLKHDFEVGSLRLPPTSKVHCAS